MIGGIFALRSWFKDHLPIENSLIAHDLILILAINNYAKNDISIKELFASVPHSYTAVRGHYLRFVKDGWVEHYSAICHLAWEQNENIGTVICMGLLTPLHDQRKAASENI